MTLHRVFFGTHNRYAALLTLFGDLPYSAAELSSCDQALIGYPPVHIELIAIRVTTKFVSQVEVGDTRAF